MDPKTAYNAHFYMPNLVMITRFPDHKEKSVQRILQASLCNSSCRKKNSEGLDATGSM